MNPPIVARYGIGSFVQIGKTLWAAAHEIVDSVHPLPIDPWRYVGQDERIDPSAFVLTRNDEGHNASHRSANKAHSAAQMVEQFVKVAGD